MEQQDSLFKLQERLPKLQEKFDYPVEDLRDILINCNLDLSMACTVCAQMGIKTKTTRKRKKDKQPPDKTFQEISPYDDPDIQELHSIFPDQSVETLACLYWDNGNNLTKTVNKILGNNRIYIPDTLTVELEYLRLKYSFLPAELVTATFIRCRNDYNTCEKTLEEEDKEAIQLHFVELNSFMQKYGRYKHRYVVELFKRSVPRLAVALEEPTSDEVANVSIPPSLRKGLTERKQAGEHLRNLRLLHCKRAEEARGYGRYLTGTLSAMEREHREYEEKNNESATTIFQLHNGSHTLEELIEKGHSVDFHGLQVKEVEQYMNRIFLYLDKKPGRKRVTIITGSGNHSRNFISPVRNYVKARLESAHVPHVFEGGQVTFSY